MLTLEQIQDIKAKLNESEISRDTVLQLISEIERLRKFVTDYNTSVNAQIQAIEDNMDLLESENEKLLIGKNTAFIERDACVALVAHMARKTGVSVGVSGGNTVVVDLPSGQVSWDYNEAEAHLFGGLPEYTAPIESLAIEEKYRRVMNSGFDQ